jgi:hypothetical protein
MIDDLLQPSLSERPPARPLFSTTTLILSGLFGGGVGALAIFTVNAQRAHRWSRDLWLITLGLPLALLWPVVGMPTLPSGVRLANKLVGLLLAMLAYWLHRDIYRAQNLFGTPSPNGWPAGIGAVVLGSLVTGLVQAALFARGLG